ncbi:MAG TPA: hypothetical protein VHE35_03305 [Kofleriaceae bacterium]|nr:hypothetical protein [Kofleriaceae bacterium]
MALAVALAACGSKKPARHRDDAAVPAAGVKARVLDDAGLAALAAVTVDTYTVDVVQRGPEFGAVIRGGAASATVTVSGCLTCTPIDLARWEAERASLTALFAPAAGDTLALAAVDRAGRPVIEARARRTVEGAPEAFVFDTWNDGTTQLVASCEQPGGADAERACSELVEASTEAYLPVLAPAGR